MFLLGPTLIVKSIVSLMKSVNCLKIYQVYTNLFYETTYRNF